MVTWNHILPSSIRENTHYAALDGVPSVGNSLAGPYHVDSRWTLGVIYALEETRAVIDGLAAPATSSTRALGKLKAGLAARTTTPCRVVFTGSSTTAGSGASAAGKRYVNLLVAALQAAYPSGTGTETTVVASTTAEFGTLTGAAGVHGYNAGEGGTTAATYLTSAEIDRVAAVSPRMVVHMVGSNDFKNGVAVATYKANVLAVITSLKSKISGPCVHLLVQPYERFDSFTPVAPWAAYGQALAEIAAADPDNVAYLDISAPYYLAGVPSADPLDLIGTDNVHQTDAGYALMADLLREALGVPGAAAAAPSTGSGAGTVFVSDSFNDADGTALTSHTGEAGATWTKHPSSTAIDVPVIAGGRVYQSGADIQRMYAAGTPLTANYAVEADVVYLSTLSAGSVGLLARLTTSDPRSGYFLQFAPSTSNWLLSKVVNGTSSTLVTTNVPLAVGKTARARLSVNGSAISASVTIDGVTTAAGSVTDSSVSAAGRAGVFFSSATSTSTGGVHLDNVIATAL